VLQQPDCCFVLYEMLHETANVWHVLYHNGISCRYHPV